VSLLKPEKRAFYPNPLVLDPNRIPTNGETGHMAGGGYYPTSTHAAMRHWAVWACVRVISDTVASLPIDLYRKSEDGAAEPVAPLPAVLIRPSAYASWLQWVHQTMVSLLLSGNAYGLIAARDRLGYPTQIDLFPPEGVTVEVVDGRKVFKTRGGKTLTTDQVWHLPGLTLPGDVEGLNPIEYASRTVGLGLNAEKFGADFFSGGAHPTAVAESEQQITEDTAKLIKQRIYEATANRQIAVLGAGLKLSPWQVNPEESQFLETQQYNAATIAQVFGVPPEKIGAAQSSQSVTYANREQRAQDYLNDAVNPWLARLEEAFSAFFPRSLYVKFNTGGFLKSDLKTRYEAHQIGITAGFLLRSEARALEDFPAIDGIDDQPAPAAPPAPASAPPVQGTNDDVQS
jgi:HK97 family phage portal protein